ncbi:MAG TPA: AAA family ATPase [Candidatus Baltobacteraceae bacterium]|nr:AAA family ATPase [Candidatus Baltobacteraceae bacterium]
MNVPSQTSGQNSARATESPLRDLEVLIRARAPLVAVESNEEPQVVRMVRQIAQKLQLKAFRWTATEGLQAFNQMDQPLQTVVKSLEVLNYIKTSAHSCLFVLLDFHPFLDDTMHVRSLKDIALTYDKHYSTVVLVGYVVRVPEELRPFTSYFKFPLPSAGELRQIVHDVAAEWGAANGNRDVQTTNKTLDLLVRNLAGLTATDARRLALKAINDNGVISDTDMPEVMRAKYELLGRDSVLSFENETARFAEIGGMKRLRNWLELRKSYFLDESEDDLDPPRGILLLGVQGCGKSLAAKAAAGIFGSPLLRLDFGVLYNKYYGETERNLRKALDTAEVMSPCVLWMDEIEKGIAVQEDDDGLSRRILGTLLTWMSEKRKAVFLVATANDIMRLPPEIVRKGRFDEIFFVDLPSEENRREILKIHLSKRNLDPAGFDLDALVKATDGFSGSEIEQAIVSAMYAARAQGAEVSEKDLLNEIQQTKPLSVVMAERIEEVRDWASKRTVPCD